MVVCYTHFMVELGMNHYYWKKNKQSKDWVKINKEAEINREKLWRMHTGIAQLIACGSEQNQTTDPSHVSLRNVTTQQTKTI